LFNCAVPPQCTRLAYFWRRNSQPMVCSTHVTTSDHHPACSCGKVRWRLAVRGPTRVAAQRMESDMRKERLNCWACNRNRTAPKATDPGTPISRPTRSTRLAFLIKGMCIYYSFRVLHQVLLREDLMCAVCSSNKYILIFCCC
jgi:hypothetical protein